MRLLPALLLAAPLAAQAADGAALFAQHCAPCHQPDGAGAVGLAPALKGDHWGKLGADKTYLPTVVVHGLSGAIKLNGGTFVGSMPAFGAQLDDATLAAIATHVRGLQGSTDSVSADDIKAARAAAGSPPATRAKRQQILGN